MRTLYIDCAMGAAGDMLTGALLELCDDRDGFIETMNGLLCGRAVMSVRPDVKCGVTGSHVSVLIDGEEEKPDGEQPEGHHHHHHHHTGIAEIREFIEGTPLSDKVKHDALEVFGIIAQAESEVHGRPVENIHFHEVGSIDALADVLSVCLLMEKLSPEKVLASPVNVGGGTVKCAHGVLPVPAPATERILRGIPSYSGEIKSELCTPTGAALLRYFVNEFCARPEMKVEKAGYGTGTKDFAMMNAVRVLLGESTEKGGDVIEISCNIDDMSGEELGFAMERIFEAGALDVWFTAITMKKSRPGIMLSCLCAKPQRESVIGAIFAYTSTIGVREAVLHRETLFRSQYERETPYGKVTVKRSEGWGVCREKAEYDEVSRLARENCVSLGEIRKSIK